MYYNSFNNAMKERFGCKIYKLALDGGFTCPTRDGTKGSRGCIFCSGKGSGDFAEPAAGSNGANICSGKGVRDFSELAAGSDGAELDQRKSAYGESAWSEKYTVAQIESQIERAKMRVAAKIRDGKYIAYYQNFTNTYAPVEVLRERFLPAILHPEIIALDIATRPDCLEPEKIALLKELNQIKPVWVELGLQTVKTESAEYIRRGFDLPVYDEAVRNLKEAGLEVITHMIIGLPGESEEDIYRTASYISESGADGIKLQLLHVLKGTDLYAEYLAGKVPVLEMQEYIRLLEGCIRRLRPEIVIHRMTGDGPKKDLAAPLWSADKKTVLNSIRAAFMKDDLIQGELIKNS